MVKNIDLDEGDIRMEKTNKLGYIAIGMVLTLIIGTVTPAFADTKDVVKQLTAYFTAGGNPISIYINGTKTTPKDADGNEVSPFMVDGTTYLPVRAVANALGKDVSWDGATASVKISDMKASATPTPVANQNNVKVDVPVNTQNDGNAKIIIKYDDKGQKHEHLDYTFTLDKNAIGEWKTVGYYQNTMDFNPTKLTDAKLWFLGMSIYSDGTLVTHQVQGNDRRKVDISGFNWTKGYIPNLMAVGSTLDVVPAYTIATIDGKTYMFLEWKSMDYIRRGYIGFYVFEKTSDTPAPAPASTPDATK